MKEKMKMGCSPCWGSTRKVEPGGRALTRGWLQHRAVGPAPGTPWAAWKGRNKRKIHSPYIPKRVLGASAAHLGRCVRAGKAWVMGVHVWVCGGVCVYVCV